MDFIETTVRETTQPKNTSLEKAGSNKLAEMSAQLRQLDQLGTQPEEAQKLGGSFGLLDIKDPLAFQADKLFRRCINIRNTLALTEDEGQETLYDDLTFFCPVREIEGREMRLEYTGNNFFTFQRTDKHAEKDAGFQIFQTETLGEETETIIRKDGDMADSPEKFNAYLVEAAMFITDYAESLGMSLKAIDQTPKQYIRPPAVPWTVKAKEETFSWPVKRFWVSSFVGEDNKRHKDVLGNSRKEAWDLAYNNHKVGTKRPVGAFPRYELRPGLLNRVKAAVLSFVPLYGMFEFSGLVSPWW